MKSFNFKYFSLFLVVIVIALFAFPQKMDAQTTQSTTSKCLNGAFSSILSGTLLNYTPSLTKVSVEDSASKGQTKMFQFDTCVQEALKKAEELALQKVKQNLLDDLVDQTVNWINNDKQPKYVMNYKDMVGNIDKEAAANVMREIDFSTYPDKQVLEVLKMGLKKQTQQNGSEIPAGSLSKKLSALPTQAEMEKASDVTSAGWGQYIDIVTDKNPNLITDAVEATLGQQKKEITSQKEFYQGAGGANSVFDCEEWVLVKKDTNYPNGSGAYVKNAAGKAQIKLTEPQSDAPPAVSGAKYICQNAGIGSAGRTGEKLNTPSNIINKTTESILIEQTVPSIVSSNDLEGYISNIADSAIFRLFKEGMNMFNKGVGRGAWTAPVEFLSGQTQESLENFLGYKNETIVTNEINTITQKDLKTRAEAIIGNATGSAQEARVTVNNRINFLDRLLDDKIATNITNCYYTVGWAQKIQMDAIGHPFPHEVNIGAIRGENQNYISSLNIVYQKGEDLLVRILGITGGTTGEIISQIQTETTGAETDLKSAQDNLSAFKDRLEGVITVIKRHYRICAPSGPLLNEN